MPLSVGQTICTGKYEILRLIGEGGQSRVWLAREVKRGLEVAIKEPLPVLSSHEREELEERFQRELKLSARIFELDVPNAVRVLTVEEHEGQTLLVMEFCAGGSLADRLLQGPLPVGDAVQLALQVCQPLQVAHKRLGLVHRDIKPSNILFTADGRAKLADFGVAQTGESGRTNQDRGPHPGTPGYMCPEQEQSTGYLSPSCDVYSLACVLFEALTRNRYQNMARGTRAASLNSAIPKWLDEVVATALDEDLWKRYRDAGDLAVALRRESKTARRRPGIYAVLAACCLGFCLVSIALIYARRSRQQHGAPVGPSVCREYLSRDAAADIARTVVGAGVHAAIAYENRDGTRHVAVLRKTGLYSSAQVHLLERWGSTYREIWKSDEYLCGDEELGNAAFSVEDIDGDGSCDVGYAESDFGNTSGSRALNLYMPRQDEQFRIECSYVWEIAGEATELKLSDNLADPEYAVVRAWFENKTSELGIVPSTQGTKESDYSIAIGQWYLDNPHPYSEPINIRKHSGRFNHVASVEASVSVGRVEYVAVFKGPIYAYDSQADESWIVHVPLGGKYAWAAELVLQGRILWFNDANGPDLYRLDTDAATIQRYVPSQSAHIPDRPGLIVQSGRAYYRLDRFSEGPWTELTPETLASEWRRVDHTGRDLVK
jgi:tRNA A-37 threonylcarbamoyl transferase component Bud32